MLSARLLSPPPPIERWRSGELPSEFRCADGGRIQRRTDLGAWRNAKDSFAQRLQHDFARSENASDAANVKRGRMQTQLLDHRCGQASQLAAGRELGRLAASVIEKLGLHSSAFHIACVGSVFRSGDVVLEPLREAVLSVAPRAEIGPPLYPPAIGAAKLAQELA